VLDEIYVPTGSLEALQKSYIANTPRASAYEEPERFNSILAKGFYFEDNSDLVFSSLDLVYVRTQVSQKIDLGIDGGTFSLKQKNVQQYDGKRYGATLFYNNFSLRLGLNKYKDSSEIVPTLMYNDIYDEHTYSLEFTKQNALFYTYSLCPYEQGITVNHFNVADYVSLDDDTDLWANLEVNSFSNSDIETTAQFDWRFYNDILFDAFAEGYSYNLALEGWYTAHSRPNTCYYSTKFSDATLVRIDPEYQYSEYFGLRAKLGLGYSFTEEIKPYKYGVQAFGNPSENLSYKAGCLHSNAARTSPDSAYNYTECELSLGYIW
jgi:hypothetical protein